MTSTLKSTDAGILSQLLGLHFDHEPNILDTTYGGGRMWRGCAYQPTTCFDVRALAGVDVVGEWDDLPRLFDGDGFEVVVYDPPHQTDGGRHALGGLWADAYGTAGPGVRGHLNISHLYPSFPRRLARCSSPRRARYWLRSATRSTAACSNCRPSTS